MTTKPKPKAPAKPEFTVVAGRKLSPGQLAYESERAKAAGKSLEAWMTAKIKAEAAAAKKPGLISRLIDKAHKPL
jgi:hypothetical protein